MPADAGGGEEGELEVEVAAAALVSRRPGTGAAPPPPPPPVISPGIAAPPYIEAI